MEIRRYSEPIAYIESVDRHREHQVLDAALNRAIWALDLARAMGEVKEGNFERWEKVAATLAGQQRSFSCNFSAFRRRLRSSFELPPWKVATALHVIEVESRT